MAAQNQARMAGVSYDVIDESQLTNINNLIGYDALIFPAMADVNTAQLPAIMSTLTSAVYNYHIGIITSGDFLTNDQTGAALPSPYANMETLLGLARASGGNSGTVTVTANDVSNPIMSGYTAGQVIQTYTNEGYTAYQAVPGVTSDVLVNQNVTGVGTLPGVVETTTGGTNVEFSSQDLLGDSNLLSHAIQSVVLGTQPGVTLHTSRDAGIVAARMDMDQSQFPVDVSATGGTGIYAKLIPILQQWNTQYNFVGSFYINIGDNTANTADPSTTNWAKSLPYYKAIQAMGSEIGNHSYTHLINPPTTTFTAHTVGTTAAGSIQVTLDTVPSFYGITVGMVVTGLNIGANVTLPGAAGEAGAVANTMVTAVSGNTVTLSFVPGGYGTLNNGVLGPIPANTTLTFSVPAENTNFLEAATGEANSATNNPFTYAYEFNQSKLLEQQMLGTTIYGAAVPGAAESYATSQNILQYYPSVAPTTTTPGYTGYVTGGWTGIGSGYPSAFGYMSPTSTGSVYIAPNMTFDFTEIQYEGKTLAQAEADWTAQFNSIGANAAGTPIVVWPIHDYGAAAWNTTLNSPTGSPYTTQMYTDFIAQAYNADYEFVTLEELASRLAAQQKAHIDYTTVGNAITATITPDPTAPDLGEMSLNVVNGGTQVIQNVTNWYAYNGQELFLPKNGGTFTVNLGATQDNVTHIASLPMRGDLLSATGDGLNLNFAMVGAGDVIVDLGRTSTPTVTGATIKSQVGNVLDLSLIGLGENDVAIMFIGHVTSVAFSADSGSSATDFVTNVAAQTISGTLSDPLGTGDVVQVSLDNGTTWRTATAAAGGMTFSLAGVVLTGSNTLLARVGTAGGAFSTSLSQAYVLDQVAPAIPSVPDLTAASDSGRSSTDNITNAATPTFTGTAEPGSTVTLLDGTTVIGTGVATGGKWSVAAPTLANGVHNLSAEATDVAGNVSAASDALSVTIDRVAPSAPVVTGLTSIFGLIATLSGTAEVGSTVAISSGTSTLGTTTVGTGGNWSWSFISAFSNTVRVLTAAASDVAGNKSGTSGTAQLGTGGGNTLTSTAGNDVFYGGGGGDTFVFSSLFGHDVIGDFAASGLTHDRINFHGNSVLNSFTNVMSHATQVGSGVVISMDANDTLTLNNVSRSSLTAADFTFV
jgi:serralysin